uniref:Uncharacterized protein n=1 Tax=Anopheles atroparvus TaxID=41427 RepID=A0A182JL33_ANOAO
MLALSPSRPSAPPSFFPPLTGVFPVPGPFRSRLPSRSPGRVSFANSSEISIVMSVRTPTAGRSTDSEPELPELPELDSSLFVSGCETRFSFCVSTVTWILGKFLYTLTNPPAPSVSSFSRSSASVKSTFPTPSNPSEANAKGVCEASVQVSLQLPRSERETTCRGQTPKTRLFPRFTEVNPSSKLAMLAMTLETKGGRLAFRQQKPNRTEAKIVDQR